MTWMEAAGLGCSVTCFLIFAIIAVAERYRSEPNLRASYAYTAAAALAAVVCVWWVGQVIA